MKERKTMPFDKNFVPALRFAVMSDIHIDDEDCIEEQRFAKALDDLKNLCSSDEIYSGFDALVIVGDFASRGSEIQMRKVKKILDAGLPADVRLIMTMASHEYMTDGEENALRRFDEIFGLTPDTHAVINGFDFIAVTTTRGCHFDDKKRGFVSAELEKAAERDGKKPIFFFQHPHITDTVYGSINWGEDEITDILINYPQIVDFSGHSHAPINDPRSVHQRHFSAFGTGTLSYFELDEFDKTHGTIPPEDSSAAQFLIVEADAQGRVRVYPYDVLGSRFFPYTWEIDEPWNIDSFKYTDARYVTAEKPYFENAGIFVENITADGCDITFTQATGKERPDSYDIYILDSDGLIKKHMNITSRYYLSDMPAALTEHIGGLKAGTEYKIKIVANSFWRTRSDALTARFATL